MKLRTSRLYSVSILLFFVFLTAFYSKAQSQITLNADGKSDTYELINKTLINAKRTAVEVPDCNHKEFGEHITQVFDKTLNKYVFRFNIHVEKDFDRCKRFDRQRNEIKTNKNSNPILLAIDKETIRYQWKFKIQKGFKATKRHTSFHQITYATQQGNEPLFALSARNRKGKQTLQVQYIKNDKKEILAQIPLLEITNQWIVVDQVIYYNKKGSYSITLKNLKGKTLLRVNNYYLETWFPNMVYARPKWGIYRNLQYKNLLRDEVLYFSDFKIDDVSTIP